MKLQIYITYIQLYIYKAVRLIIGAANLPDLIYVQFSVGKSNTHIQTCMH